MASPADRRSVSTGEHAADLLREVRRRRPLVHNITNFVAMNSNANILLAMGAAPVMAHAPEEMEDMLALADALVLNIGTLEHAWIESMKQAAHIARERGIPVILDPVGAGATTLRTATAKRLLDIGVDVLRGNLSEILATAEVPVQTRGVDSGVDAAPTAEILAVLQSLADRRKCTVFASGQVDAVTDGTHSWFCRNGHALMPRVTALGCGLSAVVAAFCAVAEEADRALAAAAAGAFYGVCGEKAAAAAAGPGSFFPAFLDALYGLTPESLAAEARIEEAPVQE